MINEHWKIALKQHMENTLSERITKEELEQQIKDKQIVVEETLTKKTKRTKKAKKEQTNDNQTNQ